jgi:hypothetical protein
MIFPVMRDRTKNQYIDWLNARDARRVVAPVEGHEGYRVVSAMTVRDLQQDDFTSPVEEDCGWFGYEGLCED